MTVDVTISVMPVVPVVVPSVVNVKPLKHNIEKSVMFS